MTSRFRFLTALFLTLLVPAICRSTTFTVTTTADNGNNAAPTPNSLRAAIVAANADNATPHTINITVSGTINLQNFLPSLDKDMTINGPTTGVTISRGVVTAFSIMAVNPGVTVTFTALTITNGHNLGNGGGIITNGTLKIINCTVTENETTLIGSSQGGGGIENSGTLTVINSTISDNTVGSGSTAFGGGIYSHSGTVTIINSTISGNTAGEGGGIFITSGTLKIINSTITENFAYSSFIGGGGIGSTPSTPVVTLHNTIVARNTGSPGPDILGPVTSLGNNLIGNTSDNSGWVASDLQNVAPGLEPLLDNGGLTRTHALGANSPAIDKGSDAVLLPPDNLTTDQRSGGYARKVGLHVDIGAFELGATDAPLPVELMHFSLSSHDGSVVLSWRTASEVDNAGFEIQRAGTDSSFRPIASYLTDKSLIGLGTSSRGRYYGYVDDDPSLNAGETYFYRLVDVTSDGVRTAHDIIAVRIEAGQEVFDTSPTLQLRTLSPNPAREIVTLNFSLREASTVIVEIYTLDGRRVARPINRTFVGGDNAAAISVAGLFPGIYTLVLRTNHGARQQQVIVGH